MEKEALSLLRIMFLMVCNLALLEMLVYTGFELWGSSKGAEPSHKR